MDEPTPKNDGKTLEDLVKWIESSGLPEGFKVETRHIVKDDDGIVIAEFDIFITGNIGTGTVSFLIECRDRPSEGAAPRSWIEQLIGRRQSLNLNKVMAVSTTGFAAGAKKLAEKVGIEIRHLNRLTCKGVINWLPLTAPLVVYKADFNAVRIRLKIRSLETFCFPEIESRFRDLRDQQPVSLVQIRGRIINEKTIWDGVPVDGSSHDVRIHLRPKFLEDYRFITSEGDQEIASLEFDAVLTATPSSMMLVDAADYDSQPADRKEQRTLAKSGRWVGGEEDIVKGLTIVGFPREEDQTDDQKSI